MGDDDDNLFTFEYKPENESDYYTNTSSTNWKHFDGEVPIDHPGPIIRSEAAGSIMKELRELEEDFWMQAYIDKGRKNLSSKKFGQTSTIVDLIKCCPQGSTLVAKDSHVPGPFHSCPNLHAHGDNYYVPPDLDPSGNKIEARVSNMMGMPVATSRKQKPKPPCKTCSHLQIQEEQDLSLYDTYKRNCTYRETFEKQDHFDSRKDVAEALKTLFDHNPEPSFQEIGRVIIPGPISSTTPTNWMEELYDLLDPDYNKKKAALETAKIDKKKKLKTFLSFPKLKSNSIFRYGHRLTKPAPSVISVAPVSKLSRKSKKLVHIKSRYLDHFGNGSGDKKKSVDVDVIGDCARVDEILVKAAGGDKSKWLNSNKPIPRGQGQGDFAIPALHTIKRPPTSTYVRLSTAPSTFSTGAQLSSRHSKLIKEKSLGLKKSQPKRPAGARKKRRKPKTKKLFGEEFNLFPLKNTTNTLKKLKKSRPHSTKKRTVSVRKGCGFEFEDRAIFDTDTPFQCIKKKSRHRKSKKSDEIRDTELLVDGKKQTKAEIELEKYKKSIFKMLETGNLMGTSISDSSPSSVGKNKKNVVSDLTTTTQKKGPQFQSGQSPQSQANRSLEATEIKSKETHLTARPTTSSTFYYHGSRPSEILKSNLRSKELFPGHHSARHSYNNSIQTQIRQLTDFDARPSSENAIPFLQSSKIDSHSETNQAHSISKYSLYYPRKNLLDDKAKAEALVDKDVDSLESVLTTQKLVPVSKSSSKRYIFPSSHRGPRPMHPISPEFNGLNGLRK